MIKTYGPEKLTIDQMHSNRQVADEARHTHYYLGTPCKHGHISPRLVSSSICVECKKMHYEKRMKPRREIAAKKRAEKEKIRKQREKEKSIKRYGPDKLILEKMKPNKREAIEAGHSHYFTGKPCRNGQLAPRTTGNATCIMCTRHYRNRYQKEKGSLQ